MARLAFLIALVALVFSWTAYRRSGGEVATIAKDVVRSAGPATPRRPRPGPATPATDDRNLEQVRRQVAELRATLERAYGNATGQTRERWKGIDGDLGRVEASSRRRARRGSPSSRRPWRSSAARPARTSRKGDEVSADPTRRSGPGGERFPERRRARRLGGALAARPAGAPAGELPAAAERRGARQAVQCHDRPDHRRPRHRRPPPLDGRRPRGSRRRRAEPRLPLLAGRGDPRAAPRLARVAAAGAWAPTSGRRRCRWSPRARPRRGRWRRSCSSARGRRVVLPHPVPRGGPGAVLAAAGGPRGPLRLHLRRAFRSRRHLPAISPISRRASRRWCSWSSPAARPATCPSSASGPPSAARWPARRSTGRWW